MTFPVHRILLVEDSWENVAYVTALLEEVDCVIDTARDGRQALALFEPGKYEVILMDCQMPVMDGFEATRRIRALEQQKNLPPVPIVALTAHVLDHIKQECFAAGMDGHLSKPFDVAQLDKVLRQFSAIRPG